MRTRSLRVPLLAALLVFSPIFAADDETPSKLTTITGHVTKRDEVLTVGKYEIAPRDQPLFDVIARGDGRTLTIEATVSEKDGKLRAVAKTVIGTAARNVWVHRRSSSRSRILATIPEGHDVRIVGTKRLGAWLIVEVDGKQGFVRSGQVQIGSTD